MWIKYHFASPRKIVEVAFTNANGQPFSTFNIQVSDDDLTWITVGTFTADQAAIGQQVFELTMSVPATPRALVPADLPTAFQYSAGDTPLPTCDSSLVGATLTVSDATTGFTYHGAYTSGGTNTWQVICSYDGSSYTWLMH